MLWFYSEVFLCTRADDHVLQHELVLQQEQGRHKVCLRFISDLEIVHKRQYFFFILSLRFLCLQFWKVISRFKWNSLSFLDPAVRWSVF